MRSPRSQDQHKKAVTFIVDYVIRNLEFPTHKTVVAQTHVGFGTVNRAMRAVRGRIIEEWAALNRRPALPKEIVPH